MKKIIQFLKATKITSRILVFLWVFFSIVGAGFNVSDFIYTFPIVAIPFLLPAFFIERAKNPLINKTVNKQTSLQNANKKDNAQTNNHPTNTNPLSYRIGGIILMIIGSLINILWIAIIMALITGKGRESITPILIICLLGILLFLTGLFMNNGMLYSLNKESLKTPENSNIDVISTAYPNELHNYNNVYNNNVTIENVTKKQNFQSFANSNNYDIDDISMIDYMDGHSFEYFCAELLKENDFINVNVTKGSGDQGVDILAEKGDVKYAFQCKNYSSVLGNKPIQEVHAGKAYYNCHVGVVITNSTFTPGAKELAQATGVLLWDRHILQDMMDM